MFCPLGRRRRVRHQSLRASWPSRNPVTCCPVLSVLRLLHLERLEHVDAGNRVNAIHDGREQLPVAPACRPDLLNAGGIDRCWAHGGVDSEADRALSFPEKNELLFSSASESNLSSGKPSAIRKMPFTEAQQAELTFTARMHRIASITALGMVGGRRRSRARPRSCRHARERRTSRGPARDHHLLRQP